MYHGVVCIRATLNCLTVKISHWQNGYNSNRLFDGVHIGHRLVIETLVQTARERGEESVIITLWPHPRIVLHSDALGFRLLNTLDEKINLLRGLGVNRVEVLPFTEEFSKTSTADYLEKYRDCFGGTAILLATITA